MIDENNEKEMSAFLKFCQPKQIKNPDRKRLQFWKPKYIKNPEYDPGKFYDIEIKKGISTTFTAPENDYSDMTKPALIARLKQYESIELGFEVFPEDKTVIIHPDKKIPGMVCCLTNTSFDNEKHIMFTLKTHNMNK